MAQKFVDVRGIIASKNPKLLKWLPRFIFRYIVRILHQDDVNQFMNDNADKHGKDFCQAVIEYFNFTVNVKGLENIPREGGCIFVANHPLGGMDAMAIVTAIHDIRPDVKFIVNDILLNVKNLKDQFVGVNKVGKNAAASLQLVDELFSSDQAVFIFPAGLVSRRKKGEVMDLDWKKTFVTRARKYNRTIVPVYIEGQLSNFFYRLSNLRTSLGIKANIEMFYLVNEFFKQKDVTMDLIFGEPIESQTFDKSKSDIKWAAFMKDKVYQLRDRILE